MSIATLTTSTREIIRAIVVARNTASLEMGAAASQTHSDPLKIMTDTATMRMSAQTL